MKINDLAKSIFTTPTMVEIANFSQKPVSVDLRVSRIYRHLAASPLFGASASSATNNGDAARW